MFSKVVLFHSHRPEIALLQSQDGSFWIGEYQPTLSHQTSKPSYEFLCGSWETFELGQLSLALWI